MTMVAQTAADPSPSSMTSTKAGTQNAAFPHLASGARPSLSDVATLVRLGTAKNVMIMAGAGISTSAGIPDFRSPGTGLYDNLAKYDLPYPEAIFDIDYLEERPEAFYALAKELYPGNFNPTTTHYFFKLLQDKGILKGVWTQNIDTLERIAGIKDDYIVEAHGSFASAACLRCKKEYTKEEIKPAIMQGQVVRCREKRCRGKRDALIKPNIVFFGEGLPDRFFERLPDFKSCDLLIVLGTSLSVGPFNSLLHRVRPSCPRVLINLELVGQAEHDLDDEGFRFATNDDDDDEARHHHVRDLFWQGASDAGVEELCRLVGPEWLDELRELKARGWRELDNLKRDDERECQVDEEEEEEEEEERDQLPVDTAVEKTTTTTTIELGNEGQQREARAKSRPAADVDDLTDRVERVGL